MKQFARCSNCRQWYVSGAVTAVEIRRGNDLHRLSMWCQRCIQEAEQRSLYVEAYADLQDTPPLATWLPHDEPPLEEATGVYGELLEEHTKLMDEALQEDDDAIAVRVAGFMERGLAYCEQLEDLEQSQRLTKHLNYWRTFLNMLNQSNQTD